MELLHAPAVIGHRGAPGHLPEHCAEGYRLAVAMGADRLETDVVMSKDGVLVVRHERELSRTTDVAARPEFAARRTTKALGRARRSGWFVEDFTLAELRTLGAPTLDMPIMTLDELLLLIAEESQRCGRRLGLHLEVKQPSYSAALGLPMTELILQTLRDHGVSERDSGVWLQCFDERFMRELRPLTPLPLLQLVDEGGNPPDVHDIAEYADAIGPHRRLVRPHDGPPTTLVDEARGAGIGVYVWTLRRGVKQARQFFAAGVDGVFTDYPDRAATARRLVRTPEIA